MSRRFTLWPSWAVRCEWPVIGSITVIDTVINTYSTRFGARLEDAEEPPTLADILEFAACKLMGVASLEHLTTLTRNQIIGQ